MYDFFFNIGNHVLEIVINWVFKIALKKDWLFAVEKMDCPHRKSMSKNVYIFLFYVGICL